MGTARRRSENLSYWEQNHMNLLYLKRRVSWLMLAALILPILAACGAPQQGGQTTPASPSPAAESPAAESPAAESPAAESPAASPSPAPESPAAASPAAESPAASTGDKVLRVHQAQYPDVFDPQKSSFTNEIAILSLIYEGLTKLNEDLETVPAAAESWEFNDDATELTFTLREGLTYSDGSPLTSENFRYAVERTCDPATAGEYQSILFEIVGCEDFAGTFVTDTAAYDAAREALGVSAPDERTLVLELTQPAPYYPTIAGLWVFYPAKQELIEQGGENWWQQAQYHVGNGIYKVASIDEEQLIVFEANENYWDGRARLDGIEFTYINDSAVALEAYRSGQLDVMQPDPSQLPAVRGDATLSNELMIYANASTFNLQPNLTREPFTDIKVRQAFSHALDRETYCEVIRNGDCTPTLSWIPEGIPGAIQTDKYGFDPEAARQALAESSYGGPQGLPPITLTFNSNDPANQPRAEWIAGQFREHLGVEVTLEPVEGTTLVELRKSPETYPQMLAFSGWIQDYPDAQNWLSVFWTCNSTFAKRPGYCNPELDAVLQQADTELDEERRVQLYEQAGEILVDDIPGAFAYNLANTFLVKPYVTGYSTTPSDFEWPGDVASKLTVDINR
jgi:oligopeptide transport system substrate-binding protein